ncbi:hypothetical protein PUN28_005281 [Cardiocondyla obscurior]|uniref:Uncharacterized protein n=1 Tax=Cardiocondyla obscurior TaxID=286306 RepID=A0AAW2GF18_9HYME
MREYRVPRFWQKNKIKFLKSVKSARLINSPRLTRAFREWHAAPGKKETERLRGDGGGDCPGRTWRIERVADILAKEIEERRHCGTLNTRYHPPFVIPTYIASTGERISSEPDQSSLLRRSGRKNHVPIHNNPITCKHTGDKCAIISIRALIFSAIQI